MTITLYDLDIVPNESIHVGAVSQSTNAPLREWPVWPLLQVLPTTRLQQVLIGAFGEDLVVVPALFAPSRTHLGNICLTRAQADRLTASVSDLFEVLATEKSTWTRQMTVDPATKTRKAKVLHGRVWVETRRTVTVWKRGNPRSEWVYASGWAAVTTVGKVAMVHWADGSEPWRVSTGSVPFTMLTPREKCAADRAEAKAKDERAKAVARAKRAAEAEVRRFVGEHSFVERKTGQRVGRAKVTAFLLRSAATNIGYDLTNGPFRVAEADNEGSK